MNPLMAGAAETVITTIKDRPKVYAELYARALVLAKMAHVAQLRKKPLFLRLCRLCMELKCHFHWTRILTDYNSLQRSVSGKIALACRL